MSRWLTKSSGRSVIRIPVTSVRRRPLWAPDEPVVPDIAEGLAVAAAGHREKVLDELRRQGGGRPPGCRRVAAQLVGVGVGWLVRDRATARTR
jgi:hypothetical protein